jgi:hypothetical protein
MSGGTALQRQGAALLGLVAVLALTISALFIAGLERRHSLARERERNGQVLQLARQALIGHVAHLASLPNELNPGRLPCPEAAGFFGTSSEGVAAASCKQPALGRLPWRTLGLEKIRDATGEPLWYAVSPGWALPNVTASLTINSDSRGKLALDGRPEAAVALIFAPGRPLQVAASAQCAARDQQRRSKDVAGNPVSPDARDFLECENATLPADGSFATVGPAGSFNDQVVQIRAADLLPALEAAIAVRVAREIVPALRTVYGGADWGLAPDNLVYPYAARFAADKLDPDAGRGSPGTLQGLLPMTRAQGCDPATEARCDPGFVTWSSSTPPALAAQTGSGMALYGAEYTPGSRCTVTAAEVQCVLYTSAEGVLNLAVSATAANVAMALRRLDKGAAAPGFADDAAATPRGLNAAFATDGTARVTFSGFVNAPGAPTTCVRANPATSVPCQRRAVSVPISVLADHALLDPLAPGTGWFLRNDWHRLSYYALSPGHAAATAAPRTCGMPSRECLSIKASADAWRARALLILAGRDLVGSTRPGAKVSDYLDSDENRNGDLVFEQRRIDARFNDRLLLVDSAP